jgi:hypothetical protein
MRNVSHLVSWVFLPLFMPFYALLIALYVPSNQDYFYNLESLYFLPDDIKSAIVYLFFVLIVLAPALSFLLLYRFGIIGTIDMEDRKERSVPMILLLVFGIMLYAMLILKAGNNVLPKYVYALPLAGSLVTITFILINQRIKVSSHAGGTGIFCGFLFAYLLDQQEFQFWLIPFGILVSGITMSARLFLEKHLPKEVYTGWLVAFFITMTITYLYPLGN